VSASRRNGRPHEGQLDLRLDGDFGDAELLARLDDLADENGWTTTLGLRMALGERVDLPERSGVGIRLGWFRRYGWVEKGEREKVESADDRGWRWSQSWRLTAMGLTLVDHPELSRQVENALGKLNPAQRLQLTRELAETASHAPDEIRNAQRRQWQRSLGR
jgi:hypothetical protein